MMNAPDSTSTRPYLIRALYEWCTDNGFTPHLAVRVDETVQVPREYVQNGEIVLNISFSATSSLQLGNEFVQFKARFAGTARDIMVPVSRVMAIYARENGQGMAFPQVADADEPRVSPVKSPASAPAPDQDLKGLQLVPSETGVADDVTDDEPPSKPPAGARPALKRIK
jgi:stringent starvation protein B